MLINIDKFRFFAQTVLPAVYDDTLSYYEVLNKTRAKLNEVIEATNAQNTTIENFINEINTAVNNFIDEMISEYDPNKTYTANMYCWYDDKVWKCIAVTTGTFDETKWDNVVFADSIGEDVNNYMIKIDDVIAHIAPEYDPNETYKEGDIVYYNGKIYRCKNDIDTPEPFVYSHWDEIIITEALSEKVDNYWQEFISNYQRTFGVTNLMGDSETDAMSQKGVTDVVYNLIEYGSYNAAKRYSNLTSNGITYTSTRDGYHCEGTSTGASAYALISPNHPTKLFRKGVRYKVVYNATNNLRLVVHYGNKSESAFNNYVLSTFNSGIYYVQIPNTAETYGVYVAVANGSSVNGDFNVQITEFASNKELEEIQRSEMKREYGGSKYLGNLVKGDVINNASLDPSTGTIANTKDVFITEYIDIEGIETLYTNCTARYCFYANDKSFISSETFGNIGGEKTISVPSNAKYIVLSGRYSSNVNIGNLYLYDKPVDEREVGYYLPYDYLTTTKTNDIVFGDLKNNSNLINLFDIDYGYAIMAANGRLTSNDNAYVTGFIPVIGGETLYTNARARYSFYDENFIQVSTATFGGASGEKSFVAPASAKYLKLSNIISYFDATELTLYRYPASQRNNNIAGEGVLRTVKKLFNGSENSYFNGKKCAWIGDSISYGSNLSNVNSAYPYLIANKLGMEITNHSIGGSAIAKIEGSYEDCFTSFSEWQEAIANNTLDQTKKYLVKDNLNSVRPYGMYQYTNNAWTSLGNTASICAYYPIVDRIKEIANDSDIIVVAAGTNDFYWGQWTEDDVTKKGGLTPIGDMNSRNKTTFYGALHTICNYLTSNFTDKQFVFVTPIQRYQTNHWNCNTPYAINGRNKSIKNYSDIIKEVCEYYSIPVIDMLTISGLVPSIEHSLFVSQSYGYVHPNENGHIRMASLGAKQLTDIRTNI